MHYISKEGCSFFGVVDARFLFCDVQLEDGMQEGFHLAAYLFCLLLATDDPDQGVISISGIEETSVVGVECVACW